MGVIRHEAAKRGRGPARHGNDDSIMSVACEVSFNLRIPDHLEVGRRNTEGVLQTLCELRGWLRTDRIERRGPKAIHVHLVFFAYGRYEAARRGVKDVLRELETMEGWDPEEIALDTCVAPLLY